MAASVIGHGTWMLLFWALNVSFFANAVIFVTETIASHFVHTGIFSLFYIIMNGILFATVVITSPCILDSIRENEKNGKKSPRYKHTQFMFGTTPLIAEWYTWAFTLFVTWGLMSAFFATFWSNHGFNPSFALGDPLGSAGFVASKWWFLSLVGAAVHFFLAAVGVRTVIAISNVVYGDMNEIEVMFDGEPQEMSEAKQTSAYAKSNTKIY